MTALTAGLSLIPLAIAAGEPGKEILQPLAVVVIGGILTSTLLDQIVTPAVFYKFGRPIADRIIRERKAAGKRGEFDEDDIPEKDVPPFAGAVCRRLNPNGSGSQYGEQAA